MSLKRLRNIARPHTTQIRPTWPSKRLRLRKLKIRRLGKKRKEGDIKNDKVGEKYKTVALPQLELISLRLQKVKKKSNIIAKTLGKLFLRSSIIIVIKRTIILKITLCQKTSYCLNNLYVNDYQLGNLIVYTFYLLFNLVLEK